MPQKVVMVTGATGGIGKATCEVFRTNDWSVLPTDLLVQSGNGFECNMRSVQQIEKLFEYCRDRYGRLDALVSAHGVHNSVKCANSTEQSFDDVMDMNFKSVFFLCREALKMMTTGSIVLVGSSVGIAADKDAPVYSASKAAVHQLVKCLAQEHGREVRVNSVAPGPVDTKMLRHAFGYDQGTINAYRQMALRGIAEPSEVAEMIYFMTSEKCRFMNGSIVTFDGGESILYSGEPAK